MDSWAHLLDLEDPSKLLSIHHFEHNGDLVASQGFMSGMRIDCFNGNVSTETVNFWHAFMNLAYEATAAIPKVVKHLGQTPKALEQPSPFSKPEKLPFDISKIQNTPFVVYRPEIPNYPCHHTSYCRIENNPAEKWISIQIVTSLGFNPETYEPVCPDTSTPIKISTEGPYSSCVKPLLSIAASSMETSRIAFNYITEKRPDLAEEFYGPEMVAKFQAQADLYTPLENPPSSLPPQVGSPVKDSRPEQQYFTF